MNSSMTHQNPEFKIIFENCNWLGFFERLRGYDDESDLNFSLNLKHLEGIEIVFAFKGSIIYPDEDLSSKVTTLPKGMKWIKEERNEAINVKDFYSSKLTTLGG